MVAVGHPVTRMPANGVQPAGVAIQSFSIVRVRLRSTSEKSASNPTAMRPLATAPYTRAGPAAIKSTMRPRLNRPALTWSSMIGTAVCTPVSPAAVSGQGRSLAARLWGAWSDPMVSTRPSRTAAQAAS